MRPWARNRWWKCTRCSGSSSERRDNLEEKESDDLGRQQPQKLFDTSRFIAIFLFLLALWSMFDNELRFALGALIGLVFYPLFGFGGRYILLTILLASITMGAFSSIVTLWHTDLIETAKVQKIMNAFNKELRDARMNNKKTKLEKLMKMQPEIMKMQSSTMGSQWKIMAYTFVIFIAVFAWLYTMVIALQFRFITVPWSPEVPLLKSYVFPVWVLLYSLISIPFGYVIRNLGKIYVLKKELTEPEA